MVMKVYDRRDIWTSYETFAITSFKKMKESIFFSNNS